ncbi:T9SS type A sorting domain-containing protein [Flavobacterium arcticum]|nr:T9SS type A sorting domain-containing protein [Flavobacterium arcticum]KAF2510935.1 T9SS type A sorting domain-containing protein [Flavobacterium arcticum]
MKKHLQWTIYSLLISILFIPEAYSQVNFSEDFESFLPYDYPGSGTDFWTSDESSCGGDISLATNLYYDPWWGDGLDVAETVTPSIGTSNGGVITLSYDYKLLTYGDLDPVENSDDWGFFQVLYATSESGPFTLLETVDTSNHIVSGDCATRIVDFSASVGAEVYLKLYAEIDNYDNDFYIFIDNIEATQAEPVECVGTPTASVAQASLVTVCNTETVTLSLSPGYTDDGLSIQWQTSTNGVDYTDVETGGDGPNYTTTQLENTWYQAIITCIASSESVTSTPVMVTSTGLPCYCDIEFDSNVEPITYVGFAGIDNTTSATVDGTPGVENFTSLTPAEVIAGQTYTITLEGNTNGTYETPFTVYIDFNQNGVLDDEGEVFLAGSVDSSSGEDGEQAITEIEIPVTAMEGVTYMRVLKLFDEYSTDPCSSEDGVGYGQAEDYLINIMPSAQLDYVNLQYPSTMDLEVGNTGTVYAQAYEPGVTEGPGAGTGVVAWIGVNDEDTDPSTWTTWILAEYNTSVTGNNDEFMADIGDGLAAGTYYYASRFQLESGSYTYGGYTATGGGYWDGVTNVSGVLTITCDTEAPIADAEQTFCLDASVQDLVADSAEGDTILWYADETGGEPLEAATLLVDEAMYYASLTPDEGCESETRTAVVAHVVTVESATVESVQPTCVESSGTIEVTAPLGTEYEYSIDGMVYQSSPIFEGVLSGTYDVYVSEEGCFAVATSVVIELAPEAPEAPTVSTIVQPTCIAPTGSLEVTSSAGIDAVYSIDGVNYQSSSTFEDLDPGSYMVSVQNNEGCISESIAVVIDAVPVVPAPTGSSTQQFDYDSDMLVYPIVGQIVVEGIDDAMYTWYASEADALAGENAISLNTEMTESATYYVTQTVDGCESEPFAVTVDIVLGREDFATGTFTYHPNPVNDILNLSYTNVIESVEVFNLIGQKVIGQYGNQKEMTVNMAELSAGTYLVKVTSDGASKTIKVVKK